MLKMSDDLPHLDSVTPASVRVRVRGVSPHPGRGAQLPGHVSGAVPGLVRGGPVGGLHHRLWLGQREAFTGEGVRKVALLQTALNATDAVSPLSRRP